MPRPKGYKHTPEAKAKMSTAMRGNKNATGHQNALGFRHTEEAKKRIAEAASTSQIGENNSNWKGDQVKYISLHVWLLRHYPKIGKCEKCNKEGKTDHAYKYNPKPYTRNREDYMELCRGCHVRYDKRR